MGLLDAMQQGGNEQMGGLLGGFMPQQGTSAGQSAQPQGQAPELPFVQRLAANPTPQVAQQVIQELMHSGLPGADQFSQVLQSIGDDPQKIKQVADAVIQKLSGQGQ